MWTREEWIKFGNISYVGQEDEKRKHSAGMSDFVAKGPGFEYHCGWFYRVFIKTATAMYNRVKK